MDNKLKQLFGYQRFAENKDLQQVIDSVHARHAARELELDDMEYIAAAGTQIPAEKQKKQE